VLFNARSIVKLIAEKKFPIRVYGMLGDNTELVAIDSGIVHPGQPARGDCLREVS
jgi:hypothetical protein